MRILLQPFRFLAILFLIPVYLLHMALVRMAITDRWRRVHLSNRILTTYCRVGLKILAVKPNAVAADQLRAVENGLFVGNHLSYLDVLVISAHVSACFVTSVEIRDTPGLGLICEMAGCLFVERRNRSNLRNEVAELRQGLERGLNVAIFPESTSTNGEQILRFRKPLFMAAIDAGAPVIPFCLNYHTVGGRPIDVRSRDKVFWYGDMDFIPHLWALAGSGGVLVDLHFRPPLRVRPGDDITSIAQLSQESVESVFRPVSKEKGPREAGLES